MTAARPRAAPPTAPAAYEADVHAWSQEQAAFLRERRFDLLDIDNLAEEILDGGRNECHRLESALRVLLTHMLKWDRQPERRTRTWENTIAEQRDRIGIQFADNPSLKRRRDEAVERPIAPRAAAPPPRPTSTSTVSPRRVPMVGTRSWSASSTARRADPRSRRPSTCAGRRL